MKTLASITLPALFGLVAGIGHGIMSHQADLPMSLTEQVAAPFQVKTSF